MYIVHAVGGISNPYWGIGYSSGYGRKKKYRKNFGTHNKKSKQKMKIKKSYGDWRDDLKEAYIKIRTKRKKMEREMSHL